MNPKRWMVLAFMAVLALVAMAPGQALAAKEISAGDEVTFNGQIEAGKKTLCGGSVGQEVRAQGIQGRERDQTL